MGSSGGGSSGKVEYPLYMMTWHSDRLGELDDLVFAAVAGNPFDGATAYDPDGAGHTHLTNMVTAVTAFDTALGVANTAFGAVLDSISGTFDTDLGVANTAFGAVLDSLTGTFDTYLETLGESWITAQIASQISTVAARWQVSMRPKFKAGMRDINSVMSSAFVTGEAIEAALLVAEAAGVGIELRGKLASLKTQGKQWIAQAKVEGRKAIDQFTIDGKWRSAQAKIEGRKAIDQFTIDGKKFVAQTTADVERIKIIAKVEQTGKQLEIDAAELKWPLDAYMYLGNLLGSIGGGHVVPNMPGVSKTATALGGMLSGAAAGAMIGSYSANPYGVAAGAAIGGIAGLVGGLM